MKRIIGNRLWPALLALSSALCLGAAEAPKLPPLSSISGNPRLPGKFVWADLVTDDLQGTVTFYQSLLGWTFRDYGGYLVAANDERPVAGVFQRPRPKDKPDARPRWFGYISVPNVERAQKEVLQGGGKILAPAQKIPDRGEQAICADPEGALFGILRSKSGDPEDFLAEPGDWIWIQLLSRDGAKAAAFYREIGGYEVVENSRSNRLSDLVLTSRGYARATVRTIPADQEQLRPSWLPFVRVKTLPESVARARQLGGKILLEPRTELLAGKVAVIADPSGAALGLLEWSGSIPRGGE